MVSSSNRAQPRKLVPANDNSPTVVLDLPSPLGITIPELEVIETYMQDIITELLAANDNN